MPCKIKMPSTFVLVFPSILNFRNTRPIFAELSTKLMLLQSTSTPHFSFTVISNNVADVQILNWGVRFIILNGGKHIVLSRTL